MRVHVGTGHAFKEEAWSSAFAETFPGDYVLVDSIPVDANAPSQTFPRRFYAERSTAHTVLLVMTTSVWKSRRDWCTSQALSTILAFPSRDTWL